MLARTIVSIRDLISKTNLKIRRSNVDGITRRKMINSSNTKTGEDK